MAGSGSDGRRERKDMRRNLERVLQAASELFAERGSDVKMEDVARRAGVGVGTIYRSFPSKEHLLAAVSQAACASMHGWLQQAAQAQPDPVNKLRALVVVQYRSSERHATLIDLRPAQAASGCPDAGEPAQLYATLHSTLRQLISDGQRQGLIRQGDPAILAGLCLELLNPRTIQHLQQLSGGSAEAVAEHAVQFVLGGLGAPCGDEGTPQK